LKASAKPGVIEIETSNPTDREVTDSPERDVENAVTAEEKVLFGDERVKDLERNLSHFFMQSSSDKLAHSQRVETAKAVDLSSPQRKDPAPSKTPAHKAKTPVRQSPFGEPKLKADKKSPLGKGVETDLVQGDSTKESDPDEYHEVDEYFVDESTMEEKFNPG
jgi:hypothetical protein